MKKRNLIYKDPGAQSANEEETNQPAQEAGNGESPAEQSGEGSGE